MRIWVAVASVGRAELLCRSLARLSGQTRPADGIVVVGCDAADVAGVVEAIPAAQVLLAERGLCRQRNAALEMLRDKSDAIVFFDDDFLPERHFLETMEREFTADPKLVGLTGVLMADGAHTSQIAFEDAADALDRGCAVPTGSEPEPINWLYGCNMAFRTSAIAGLSFDEALPLYGWQEDVDFSNRLSRRGAMRRTSALTGIHLGTRGGRQSGLRLGYSQVANVVYLLRKGTIGRWHGLSLMARNIAMNGSRSLWPESGIDRRGRLRGNALAAADILRGRVTPQRIEQL